METEVRHIERIKKKLVVKVNDRKCMMVDISKVGMRLVLPFLLKSREINVVFQMEDELLVLECRVCWIKKELNIYQQPQYQVGLYIPEPTEEYVRLVDKLMTQ
jgi:hypothetical protein